MWYTYYIVITGVATFFIAISSIIFTGFKSHFFVAFLVVLFTFDLIFWFGTFGISIQKAHSVAQMPQVVADMAEKHYAALKDNVSDAADKAVAFVMVPTEVVSEYILSSRPVQWIIPNIINADEIKILEDIDMEEIERELQEGVHFAKQ